MTLLRYLVVSVVATLLAGASLTSFAVEGLITIPSAHSAATTMDMFEAAVKKRGFMVFTRLDHAAAAESV